MVDKRGKIVLKEAIPSIQLLLTMILHTDRNFLSVDDHGEEGERERERQIIK
jgi:hypothetical protein